MSEIGEKNQFKYEVEFPGLPLAVYREIAAHLRQVTGVETGLTPQQSQDFDYDRSQVGSLWIEYLAAATSASQQRVEQILAFYQQRYGKAVIGNH
ncbi:acyltransferase [Phormidium sp. LEGE 05292]|uniref:acyltransferase n=1 Tax=[Phormidium] sp. LEGE 05292 TaxID=767427 RepID=UPI00187EB12C|nr:acyltransferase [Phormidium sp. LEGE 05292]MBE9224318.1 acyltransferase [Phormidium sp. LEGE 05292]